MTVETITADSQKYASGVMTQAGAALTAAAAAVQNVGWTGFFYNPPPGPAAPTLPDQLALPTFADIGLDLPAEPGDTLALQDISAIQLGTVPTFDTTAPTISLPNLPAALPGFTAVLPAINTNLAFPDVPAALANPVVDAPNIVERTAPVKPTVTLPGFEGIVPTDEPAAPTDLRGTFESAKAIERTATLAVMDAQVDAWLAKFNPQLTTQMAVIEAQLTAYLAGGTGMSAVVENAIYERSRSKQSAETRRTRDAAARDAAKRGHTLPPGVLVTLDLQARQAGADNLAASAREIVVQAAEWEQKNLQFAVDRSIGMRKDMLQLAMSYHQNCITINAQALEAAKNIVSLLVQAYDIARQVFATRLEVFKAQAVAYETRVRAAMSLIELYRAEIQAEEALLTADRLKIETYTARINALQVFASVFRAQVEAVQGRASLEKLKLDLLSSQVQAYDATVRAHNGELDAYRAAIGGETAKVQLYEAQTRTFGVRTDAYRAQIDAQARAITAQAESNRARSDAFRALLAKFSSIVEARGKAAAQKVENQRQLVHAFEAATHAQVARFDAQSGYYRSVGEIAVQNGRLSLEALFKTAENQRAFAGTIAQLATNNAGNYSHLAASAVSSLTTLASQTLVQ